MCGCGRTSWLSEGCAVIGPNVSKNRNGPTAWPQRRRQAAAHQEAAAQVFGVGLDQLRFGHASLPAGSERQL